MQDKTTESSKSEPRYALYKSLNPIFNEGTMIKLWEGDDYQTLRQMVLVRRKKLPKNTFLHAVDHHFFDGENTTFRCFGEFGEES